MKDEKMTVDEVYRKLKGDIDVINHTVKGIESRMATKDDLIAMRDEFRAEISKMRTWVVSVFIGAVIFMVTLMGFYAAKTIALLT